MFRSLKNQPEGEIIEKPLSNIYRPIHELNERRVTSNDFALHDAAVSAMVQSLHENIDELRLKCSGDTQCCLFADHSYVLIAFTMLAVRLLQTLSLIYK